jgi:hypothetical protein
MEAVMTNRQIEDFVSVAALVAAIALSLDACSSTSRTTSSTQSSETSNSIGTSAEAAVPDTDPGRDTVPVPSPPDTLPRPR